MGEEEAPYRAMDTPSGKVAEASCREMQRMMMEAPCRAGARRVEEVGGAAGQGDAGAGRMNGDVGGVVQRDVGGDDGGAVQGDARAG